MSNFKHFGNCYRNIKGVQYLNYADLVMQTEEMNQEIVDEAKASYELVKKIKHHTGEYYQVFVANPKNEA